MSSTKKKTKSPRSLLEYDEDGKIILHPLKIPDFMCNTGTKNNTAQKQKLKERKIIPIKPLILTSADLEEGPGPSSKVRKVEKSVCKELFKVPKSYSRPSLRNRQSLSRSSMVRNKNAAYGRKSKVDSSPLMNIDDAEKMMTFKKSVAKPGYPFNPPKKPVTKFSNIFSVSRIAASGASVEEKMTPKKFGVNDLADGKDAPGSKGSDSEFLEMEKACNGVTEAKSPLSAVCNLLRNTKINQPEIILTKPTTVSTVVEEIKQILERDKRQFEAFRNQHKQNVEDIMKLLGELKDCDCDKENKDKNTPSRRSSRTTNKPNVIVRSPAISKGEDLRKKTLNKNLAKTVTFEVQSPRLRRAVDMYNSFRTDCSVLCTPKLDRNTKESPARSMKRSLSRRIQNQCLMLQDSPK